MTNNQIDIAGIKIPFVSPFFVGLIAFHVFFALICTIAGILAMLTKKRAGLHPTFGKIYYWILYPVFASATALSALRWEEDYHLFFLGCISFFAAIIGRTFIHRRLRHWVRMHIIGMGVSYVFLLVAFYVDNGKNLPIWRDLPHFLYWLMPMIVGAPIIVFALFKYTRTSKEILL